MSQDRKGETEEDPAAGRSTPPSSSGSGMSGELQSTGTRSGRTGNESGSTRSEDVSSRDKSGG